MTLVYYEEADSKKEAMQREYAIKRLDRKEKLSLIEGFEGEQRRGRPENPKDRDFQIRNAYIKI